MDELFKLRSKMILEGCSKKELDKISYIIKEREVEYSKSILEDDGGGEVYGGGVSGVGYADASNVSGMGGIVSSQPSTIPGALIGSNWSDNGGTIGSGDISVPYNAGGTKVFQKMPVPGHGSMSTKKNKSKLDLKKIKDMFNRKQDTSTTRVSKVMSFDNFNKEKINKVTKVKDI